MKKGFYNFNMVRAVDVLVLKSKLRHKWMESKGFILREKS